MSTGPSIRTLFLRAVILSFASATLAIYTLGPLSQARWAIQDDHEIAFFTGPSGRLAFSDIPRMLKQTEVGKAGRTPRFRPAYMGLRLLESSLWGFSPAGWYRTRLVMYAVTAFLVGWVVASRVGTLPAVALLVWVLSPRYWFQVWGRLGPPESYAAFGSALWAFGMHLLWPSCKTPSYFSTLRRRLGLVLFMLGNAVAVGAKENFPILAAPNAMLALIEMRSGRTSGVRWWACLVNVFVAATVVMPLAVYFASVPVDYYGRSVAFRQRIIVLALGTAHLTIFHIALILALALWLATRLPRRFMPASPGPAWWRLTSGLLVASASALVLFLSQYVFYNGDITRDTNYEFPAALAWPGLVLAISLCLREFFPSIGAPKMERVVFHLSTLGFVAAALVNWHGFVEQREISRGWAAATRDFTTRITAAADTARAAPNVPIVIVSGRPSDYEPIWSVARFLRSLGASNPRFLLLDWETNRSQWSPLEAYLAPGLERLAGEGAPGIVRPWRQFDPAAPCLSIGLTHHALEGCRDLGRFW